MQLKQTPNSDLAFFSQRLGSQKYRLFTSKFQPVQLPQSQLLIVPKGYIILVELGELIDPMRNKFYQGSLVFTQNETQFNCGWQSKVLLCECKLVQELWSNFKRQIFKEKLQYFRQMKVVQRINFQEEKKFLSIFDKVYLPTGACLFRLNSSEINIFFLFQGDVKLKYFCCNGRAPQIQVGKFDCLGMKNPFQKRTNKCVAIATSKVQVYRARIDELQGLQFYDFMQDFHKYIINKNNHFEKYISTYRTVPKSFSLPAIFKSEPTKDRMLQVVKRLHQLKTKRLTTVSDQKLFPGEEYKPLLDHPKQKIFIRQYKMIEKDKKKGFDHKSLNKQVSPNYSLVCYNSLLL